MFEFNSFGKTLMFFGVVMLVLGALFHFGGKIAGLGRLPGDIRIERENFSFYFPLVSCLLVSVVLTLLLNLFSRR